MTIMRKPTHPGTVLKEDVPAFSSNNLGYFVRYRVISSDKNRSSHWSPQYRLPIPSQTAVEYAITANPTSKMINLVWQTPSSSNNKFDV